MPLTELPPDSVRAVGLNVNVVHQRYSCHPKAPVLRANRRYPERFTSVYSQLGVGLPHNVFRCQLIKLSYKLRIGPPRLYVVPTLLHEINNIYQ